MQSVGSFYTLSAYFHSRVTSNVGNCAMINTQSDTRRAQVMLTPPGSRYKDDCASEKIDSRDKPRKDKKRVGRE